MADGTGISWTDATWNPVRGCSRVSEGCRNCYAERMAARFSDEGQPYHGLARRVLKTAGASQPRWTGEVRMVPEHLADPLRWKKPRRIFVNSMSDLFHEGLSDEDIAVVVGVMLLAAQHTYQVLTKRPRRMREFFNRWTVENCIEMTARSRYGHLIPGGRPWNRPPHKEWLAVESFPVPWIWLGTSVENQDAADERIPELLKTPAAVRFLSCEPLIGQVDVRPYVAVGDYSTCPRCRYSTNSDDEVTCPNCGAVDLVPDFGIDWVIAGCESGPGARPCSVEWLRSLRDQCAAAGVAYFLKQAKLCMAINPNKDADISVVAEIDARLGSKRKGGSVIELPYLDGVQHAAFPVRAG